MFYVLYMQREAKTINNLYFYTIRNFRTMEDVYQLKETTMGNAKKYM